MPSDPRVDAYIEKVQPFAKPILSHLRATVHQAAPGVEEAIKWGMPFFLWKGAPLANMAAFKAHASFGFWRREGAGPATEAEGAMGQFGRLTSVADLPPDSDIEAMVRDAIAAIEAGTKTRRPPRAPKAAIAMPDDLEAALSANPAAAAGYAGFPPGAQREYLAWVLGAKQSATRARRIETTVNQCAEGKRLHWKYENC
jgi:hypothetical protein